ncbi:flagellar hook-length control protein FliK [Roseibium litorale]|uniref:Flagellar hook-length control protein FliK n=1 Tax=Roseibium litorale TaxID=2803841 RepID=A0ABR9CKF9_9HYPH|nr:flagellar hook-length control protein FliK [Roseibium litorale]MBD8891334.1 flagellar hook-length control protein FliK [Roseibium litorale]
MGAPLLPVGLYTEVSSNALSAGQGAAASSPASALDAFSQVLANLSGDGEAAGEDLGTATVPPSSLAAKVKVTGPQMANAALPDLSSLDGLDSGAQIQLPVLNGAGPDELQLDADAPVAGLTGGLDAEGPAEFELPADDADEAADDPGMPDALAMIQPVPVPPAPVSAFAEVAVDAEAGLTAGAVDAGAELASDAPAQGAGPQSGAGEEISALTPQAGMPVQPQAEVPGAPQLSMPSAPVPQPGVPQASISSALEQQFATVEAPSLSATASMGAAQLIDLAADVLPADADVEALAGTAKAQVAVQVPSSAPVSSPSSEPPARSIPVEGGNAIAAAPMTEDEQADVRTPAIGKADAFPAQAQAVGFRDLPAVAVANSNAAVNTNTPVAAGLDADQAVAAGVRDRMTGVVPAAEAGKGNVQTALNEGASGAPVLTEDEGVVVTPVKAPGKRWLSELPELARSAQSVRSQAPATPQVAAPQPAAQPDPVLLADLDGGESLKTGETLRTAVGQSVPDAGETVLSFVKTSPQTASTASLAQAAAGAQGSKPGQGAAKAGENLAATAQPVLGNSAATADEGALPVSATDALADGGDLPSALSPKPQVAGQDAAVPGAPVTAGTQKSDAAAKSDAAGPAAMAAAGAAVLTEDDSTSGTDGLTMDGEFATQLRTTNQHLARMDAATAQAQTQAHSQTGQAASQIASAMARTLSNGDTKFQMRLDPPELGRVEVHMKVAKDGSVQAHMIVDSPETLDMFMRDQRGLERALANAGLNTDSSSLQFSLRDDGGQGFASSQDNGSGGGHSDRSSSSQESDDAVSEPLAGNYARRNQSGLDVRV